MPAKRLKTEQNETPEAPSGGTPPKLIPKPKTAAERAARAAKILELLDRMYPRRHLRAPSPQPLGIAGGNHPFGAVYGQARQRGHAGTVRGNIPSRAISPR